MPYPHMPWGSPQQAMPDEQGRELSLWKRLAEAYERAEAQKRYAQFGRIGAFLGATIAGPDVQPAFGPYNEVDSMADDTLGSARAALDDYSKVQSAQTEREQAEAAERHRQAQLALEGRRLDQDQDQFDDRLQAQIEADRARLAEMEEQGMDQDAYREHQMSMDERQLALQRHQLAQQGELARLSQQQKQQEQVETGVRDLSKQIAEDPTAASRAGLNEKLQKYKGKNLPGVGPIEGRLPKFMAGEEGREMRSLISTLNLALTKVLVGAGSDKEKEMAAQATQLMKSSRDEDIRKGIELANEAIRLSNQQAKAGYPSEVVNEYDRRFGSTTDQEPELPNPYPGSRRIR